MRSIVCSDIGDPSPLCGSWVWDGFFHRSKKAPGTSSPPTTSLTSPQRTWLAQLGNTPNWGSSLKSLDMSCRYWAILKIQSLLLKSGDGHLTIFLDFVYASLDSLWWEDHPLISMKTSSFSCPNSRFGDEEIGFNHRCWEVCWWCWHVSGKQPQRHPKMMTSLGYLSGWLWCLWCPGFTNSAGSSSASAMSWYAQTCRSEKQYNKVYQISEIFWERSFSACQHSACSKTIQNLPVNELK